MGWPNNPRPAKGISKLRSQLNGMYPSRDKTSDGMIGDAAHQSRASDHNPWIVAPDGTRVVSAIDIDKDLSPTKSVNEVVDALVASRDSRIKYIIWRSRMISSYPANGYVAWEWRPYRGKNSHSHHVHVSVREESRFFDDDRDWTIVPGPATPVQPEPEPAENDFYIVQAGDSLWKIAKTFKTTVGDLELINDMKPGAILSIGKRLKLR